MYPTLLKICNGYGSIKYFLNNNTLKFYIDEIKEHPKFEMTNVSVKLSQTSINDMLDSMCEYSINYFLKNKRIELFNQVLFDIVDKYVASKKRKNNVFDEIVAEYDKKINKNKLKYKKLRT